MAKIAFTWELGGGMGHIIPYVPLLKTLRSRGHDLIFILKDLSLAPFIKETCEAICFQAPLKTWRAVSLFKKPLTYAHILHNIAFDNPMPLAGLIEGWRSLFQAIRPDLVVFEHSPTALLSAGGLGFRKMLIGTGFTIPLPVYPFPNLAFWIKADEDLLRSQEDKVAAIANKALDHFRLPGLTRMRDLFASEPQVLKTFKELDPYKGRDNAHYYGTWPSPVGEEPVWPAGHGKRVFVYLKPFQTLPSLLDRLSKLEVPAIVYVEKIGHSLKEKFDSPTLSFVDGPQDIGRIAAQCDLAILNATHNTSANLLLAGKPALHLPLFLEQILTAYRIDRLGAGVAARSLESQEIATRLDLLLSSESYEEGARRFAARYASMGGPAQNLWLTDFIEGILASRGP